MLDFFVIKDADKSSVVIVLKILQAVGFGQILEEKPRFRIRFLDVNILNGYCW